MRQSRSVIDPVSNHGHFEALFLILPDDVNLILRENLGSHFIDPDFLGHDVRHLLIVPSNHEGFQAQLIQATNRFLGTILEHISQGDNPDAVPSQRNIHCRLAGLRQPLEVLLQRTDINLIFLHQFNVSDQQGFSLVGANHPVPALFTVIFNFFKRKFFFASTRHYCLSQRVNRRVFPGRRDF